MSVSIGADNLKYLSKFNNQTVNRLLRVLTSKDPLTCTPEDVLAVLPKPVVIPPSILEADSDTFKAPSGGKIKGTLEECSTSTDSNSLFQPTAQVSSDHSRDIPSTSSHPRGRSSSLRREREAREQHHAEPRSQGGLGARSNKKRALAKDVLSHSFHSNDFDFPLGDSLSSESDFDRRWFDPPTDSLRGLGPDYAGSEFGFGFGDALLEDVPFSPARAGRRERYILEHYRSSLQSPRPPPSSPLVPGPSFRSAQSDHHLEGDEEHFVKSATSAVADAGDAHHPIHPYWTLSSGFTSGSDPIGSIETTALRESDPRSAVVSIEPIGSLPDVNLNPDGVPWSQTFETPAPLPAIPSLLLSRAPLYFPLEDLVPVETARAQPSVGTPAADIPASTISKVSRSSKPRSSHPSSRSIRADPVLNGGDAPISNPSVPESEHNDDGTSKEREDFSELCREIFSLLSLPLRAPGKNLLDEKKLHSLVQNDDLGAYRGNNVPAVAPNKIYLFNATILSKLMGKPTLRRRISDILSFLEALEVIEQDRQSRYWKTRNGYRERLITILSSLHREATRDYPKLLRTQPHSTEAALCQGTRFSIDSHHIETASSATTDASESDVKRFTKEVIKIYLLSPPYVTTELVESLLAERGVIISSKLRRLIRYVFVMLFELTLIDSCKIENIYVINALKTFTWGTTIPMNEIISHSE